MSTLTDSFSFVNQEILSLVGQPLLTYINNYIFPEYDKNDSGHKVDHIINVIERSFKFAKTISGIDYEMVYAIAAYHDIGHHIDSKTHEIISANILRNDKFIQYYFSRIKVKIMAEAVEDHRASSGRDPRNIYGKIVSSADRTIDLDEAILRMYLFRIDRIPKPTEKQLIEESWQYFTKKYSKKGYSRKRMYFKGQDEEYNSFIAEAEKYAKSKELFIEKYRQVISNYNQTKTII